VNRNKSGSCPWQALVFSSAEPLGSAAPLLVRQVLRIGSA